MDQFHDKIKKSMKDNNIDIAEIIKLELQKKRHRQLNQIYGKIRYEKFNRTT